LCSFVQLPGFVARLLFAYFCVFLLGALLGGRAELAGVFATVPFFDGHSVPAAAAQRERGDRRQSGDRARRDCMVL
jgi:hypothetical protein